MGVTVKVQSLNVASMVGSQVASGVKKAAEYMKMRLKEKVSQGYSPPPSLPGNPPHVDTGELWNSITYRVQGTTITFKAAQHGIYLEYGTSKMAARPWLNNTMLLHNNRVQHIVAKG